MKVYSLEETLALTDYRSRLRFLELYKILLNTEIEDKEYSNETINKFFVNIVTCVEKCFIHYSDGWIGSNNLLSIFYNSEILFALNKIKEKVKPIFTIDVLPKLYDSCGFMVLSVTINNTTRYYRYILRNKKGFEILKEEDYIHYSDLIEAGNSEKLSFIPLKEMEF